MPITRRSTLHLVACTTAAMLAPGAARALVPALVPPALTGDRALGKPDAPVTVIEYFSLTCTHCAAFANETFPQVRADLIDKGRVRYVFGDFPLDQLALHAAMLARALPVERYEPFILSLFASQNRWAFDRNANVTEELFKRAAVAGMDRATFDSTLANTAFQDWILAQQKTAEDKYGIDSTPSFIINGRKVAGEMAYDKFIGYVNQAT
jgi:protein-disulfide isomerase